LRSSGFEPISVEIFNNRLKKVTFLVIAVIIALVLRLWVLQILNGPKYRIRSESNRIHLQDIPPFRGMIFGRDGELLVDNRPSYDLYVIPEDIQDREQLKKSFQKLVALDSDEFEKKLDGLSRKRPFEPVLLKNKMSRDELAVIETNLFNLPGAMIQVRPQRHYIFGKFASHVVGYLGEISESQLRSGNYPENKPGDFIGKYGVEMKWQNALNGTRGGQQVEVDAAGRKLRVITRKPPDPGYNIHITIHKELQYLAEKAMKGKRGAIIAMDPNNGEILALASGPTFDPNLFIGGIAKDEWKKIITGKDYPLQNRAVSGIYPPGSVFKIVVALAGLEEAVIDPNEEIFCEGKFDFGDRTYRCWKEEGHGFVDLHRALVESCDVYFYNLGLRLGVEKIAQYARMFGLGKRPDFDLGGDNAGLVPTKKWKLKRRGEPWQAGETVTLAIGQSYLLVTPLQMVQMISAVFNGGYLFQPKIIQRVGKVDGELYRISPTVSGRIRVKQENMERIQRALLGVVNEPQGTGYKAMVDGVEVAGKTGTAQVVKLDLEKDYEKEEDIPHRFRDHAWFVANAGVDRPDTLAVAVIVEHGGHGASAAAPISKALIQAYFKRGYGELKEGDSRLGSSQE
jgi:penicillin-binding protein 2